MQVGLRNGKESVVSLILFNSTIISHLFKGKQYCRGVYAISVNGAPPGHIVAEAKESGRPYHNRNRASYQST